MIHGKFKSISNVEYSVEINCPYDYEIGSDDTINFTDEPIEINQDISDTFEHIIKTQAEINLLVKNYLGDYIFSADDRSIEVFIYRDNKCIFNGYIQPQTYNQDFASEYTELTLNCQDYLCTLENHRYRENEKYSVLKTDINNVSFKDILIDIFGTDATMYFDNSVKVDNFNNNIFEICGVSELLLIGEEEEDLWTQEETLREMLQYLNLHIVQIGKEFFIFSWNNVKRQTKRLNFYPINLNNTQNTGTYKNSECINITADFYKSDDTQISLADVYNRIVIECDLTENETIFNNPLDDDNLVSPFTNKNRFLVETEKGKTKTHTWYFQYKTNPNWKLRYANDSSSGATKTFGDINDLIPNDNGVICNQYKIAENVSKKTLCPLFCSFGKVEEDSKGDNAINNKLDMSNYLIITINGSENKDIDTSKVLEKWNKIVEQTGGIVEFNSNATGVISPTDENVTNYLVFSGRIMLQPPIKTKDEVLPPPLQHIISPADVKCKWYDGYKPGDHGEELTIQNGEYKSLFPYFGYESLRNKYGEKYGQWFQYRQKDGVDEISKIPIIICQLSIGDKYCVETNGSSSDSINEKTTFEWLTLEECKTRNLEPTFALGINPKIGDWLLCTDFNIQNTLSVTDNVDGEGTAIPIKYTDNLSGKINFKILSPAYVGWGQQIRRHPTAFRHTKWWTTELPLMEYVQNIYIQDFECKLYSNNANVNNMDEKNLIYMSDVTHQSIQAKDDITFKFNTALTTTEAIEKGVLTTSKLSNVVNMISNGSILNINSIYSSSTSSTVKKPEEHYINDYYYEYFKPKVMLETSLNLNKTSFWNHYKFSYFKNKEFYVLGTNLNLKTDTCLYTLKEI